MGLDEYLAKYHNPKNEQNAAGHENKNNFLSHETQTKELDPEGIDRMKTFDYE